MTPKTSAPSRTGEIWKRLGGLFGADAVERKFGLTPPPEWDAMIGRLRDFEIDRGLRRLVYGGKGHVPTLPEFVKLCRTIGTDEGVDDGPKPLALPNPDGFTGDGWDVEANLHLLGYLTRRMSAEPRCFGGPASYEAMQDPMRAKDKTLDSSPDFVRAVGILVAFKNAWARDMREGNLDPATGELKPPSVEEQKAAWADCMQRAETAIAQKAAA